MLRISLKLYKTSALSCDPSKNSANFASGVTECHLCFSPELGLEQSECSKGKTSRRAWIAERREATEEEVTGLGCGEQTEVQRWPHLWLFLMVLLLARGQLSEHATCYPPTLSHKLHIYENKTISKRMRSHFSALIKVITVFLTSY